MFPLLRCLLMPSPSLLLAPLNFKSAFSLQRIFRCQIFPCEDWQFGVLVFAVLFAWKMAWDSPIVNIVLQTTKRQLFMNTCTLVIDGNSKSLSVQCCLETKMRRDVKLLYDVMADTIGYKQVKMKTATLQLARTHTRFTHWARFARDEIILYQKSTVTAPQLMFPNHNPHYGSKQQNQNNCGEKGNGWSTLKEDKRSLCVGVGNPPG